ncbi:hypothetical protein D3C84_1181370 [compost metagenome]
MVPATLYCVQPLLVKTAGSLKPCKYGLIPVPESVTILLVAPVDSCVICPKKLPVAVGVKRT